MSTTAIAGKDQGTGARAGQIDLKLEVITVPISDIERAKEFYESLGWRLDADFRNGSERAVQFTPPGSACSIHLGTKGKPGSAQGLFLIVPDIEAAREELMRCGVAVGEVFHFAAAPAPFGGIVSGIAPGHISYGSYAGFTDPDGNGWLLQEVTTRLPGRLVGDTTYSSVTDLAQALRRAEAAHGDHEKRTGHRDENWPAWYAEYMVREQSGEELPL